MDRPEIKVGDKYYTFDINRRVYKPGDSGPDYRGHFSREMVVGETSRSWLIGSLTFPRKVPKKDPWSVLYTEAMVEDAVWVRTHAHRVAARVRDSKPAVLRKVAEIIGYDPL